jgi:hypothetical protein
MIYLYLGIIFLLAALIREVWGEKIIDFFFQETIIDFFFKERGATKSKSIEGIVDQILLDFHRKYPDYYYLDITPFVKPESASYYFAITFKKNHLDKESKQIISMRDHKNLGEGLMEVLILIT